MSETSYNEKTKASIYKWKEENPEAWKEQQRKNSKSYYERNKKKCIEKNRNYQKKQKQEVTEKLDELAMYKAELARYKEMYGDTQTTTIVQTGITT